MDNKEKKDKVFTINPKDWFIGYWGLIPKEDDFKALASREPGALELLHDIFSERDYQNKYRTWDKEKMWIKRNKGENNEKLTKRND